MGGWWSDGSLWRCGSDGLVGPDGPADLSPNAAPAAQRVALAALVTAGLGRADTASLAPTLARLADRPYRLDGVDTAAVDAVRGQAAWLAASVGEAIPLADTEGRSPFVVALATGRGRDDWLDVAGWLAAPTPRWVVQDQVYEVRGADRWLMWVGLVRSVDVEAFRWYRAGVVLLDAALGLDGRLDDVCREAWATLVEVRPGPRDWRVWHDDLAAQVPVIHARRTAG